MGDRTNILWKDATWNPPIGRRGAGDQLLGRQWRQFPPGTLRQPQPAGARRREKALALRAL